MSFKELKMEPIASDLEEKLEKLYSTKKRAFVKVGENKWYLPYTYRKNGDKLYNFKIRSDDTWIITYPRSGTTVTQELVWLVANDLNFDEANRRTLFHRFPFIDMSLIVDNHTITEATFEKKSSINYVEDQPSPRFIKCHLPLDLLPTVVNSDCKIIYVARNPKDVAISWYHFQKHQKHQYVGTFEDFCNIFMADHTIYSPYWKHVKEGWAKRHKANTLFLFYEDLNKDLPGFIKRIVTFFGKSYTEEQIAKLAEHLNIDNFRKNPMVNQVAPDTKMKAEKFIRQGRTGGWKEEFTPEMDEKFNKWIADNLKDTDLTFPS